MLRQLCKAAIVSTLAATPVLAQPADADKDARMRWWRDARFGMFIHWGLYAVPAGEWDGKANYAEWIRHSAQIPIDTYDQFREEFNPVKFDADEWAAMAKDAGMQYIVITSKHHDGFCLFDSEYTDFDIMSTPFKRDIMAELSEATRAQGLKMCWYHSIMDWHHPDYLPRRSWEVADRPEGDADMDRYVSYMFNQVTELLTEYGDIGVMWFDGEWEATWNSDYGEALYKLCRALQPNVIVNNRVDKGRGGMGGMSDEGYYGDFGTPEQQIPATGIPGVDWETCMTMNGHWGYNAADKDFKTTEDLVRKLCDIASKGGNFLLNIGPKADGTFPQESIDRLREIGDWMDINSEAIYGTSASPFGLFDWGRCTMDYLGDNHLAMTDLYFHVFDWPTSGVLRIEGLGSEALGASLLAAPDREVGVVQKDGVTYLQVGTGNPGKHSTVVKLSIAGYPIVYRAPTIETLTDVVVGAINVTVTPGSPGLITRYTLDGSEPTATSPQVGAPIEIDRSCTLSARSFHEGKPVSGTTKREFRKVDPRPGRAAGGAAAGLECSVYSGDWDAMPKFAAMTPEDTQTVASIGLPAKYARERVGHRYSGMIRLPADAVYQFALTSDDGSRLFVGDTLVVDHDGLHSSETKVGVAALGAGWHPITVEWFNKTGGADLSLKVGPVGGELAPVPAESLSH